MLRAAKTASPARSRVRAMITSATAPAAWPMAERTTVAMTPRVARVPRARTLTCSLTAASAVVRRGEQRADRVTAPQRVEDEAEHGGHGRDRRAVAPRDRLLQRAARVAQKP